MNYIRPFPHLLSLFLSLPPLHFLPRERNVSTVLRHVANCYVIHEDSSVRDSKERSSFKFNYEVTLDRIYFLRYSGRCFSIEKFDRKSSNVFLHVSFDKVPDDNLISSKRIETNSFPLQHSLAELRSGYCHFSSLNLLDGSLVHCPINRAMNKFILITIVIVIVSCEQIKDAPRLFLERALINLIHLLSVLSN